MKKLFSMVLVVVLALSLASCGTKETGKSVEEKIKGKTLTVGIWGGNDAEAAALNQVIKDFEAKTGAKIELKTYTDINTQIQADFIGGTAPDVFYVDGSMFPFYATLDVMLELDAKEMGTDAYYSNLMDAFTTDEGKIYAIPKDVSVLATYVNTDILEEVGLQLSDIPTALEDMVTFLPELQAKLDAKYGVGQVTAMTYNQDLARNLHLFERNEASLIDENEMSTLSSDGVIKNLDFMMDLVNTGAYKTPAEIGLGWNGEVFGTGKCVIMEEGNWVYGNLKQNYPEINFEVIDMPTYLGEKSSMSFTVGYAVYSKAKEVALAKEWIKYATGDGMATWVAGAGCLPSRNDVATEMKIESDPVMKTHLAQVEYAVPWQKGTTISIINSAYQNYIQSVVSGEMTTVEAMKKADTQANDEINNSK
ncbi:MAG: sugar transporter substrate-binding protein [Clostridiales bacterium]|jgi:multiple sugar transport system substrate-binding protein|nr:sugar transporter substrate-binding protein [Clostridiales bacterium]